MAISPPRYVSYDLDSVIRAVKSVWDTRGDSPIDADALADVLEYTSKNSGTFLTKLGNLRLFGLLEGPSSGMRVTPLARKILHPEFPEDGLNARAEAFENVPLFKAVLDRYSGVPLPSREGLTNYLVSELGLTQDKASYVYIRLIDSAQQAGLFNADKTKLLRRTSSSGQPSRKHEEKIHEDAAPQYPKTLPSPRDSKVVDGALDMLPSGDSGWSNEELTGWLDFFERALRIYYKIPKPQGGGNAD